MFRTEPDNLTISSWVWLLANLEQYSNLILTPITWHAGLKAALLLLKCSTVMMLTPHDSVNKKTWVFVLDMIAHVLGVGRAATW